MLLQKMTRTTKGMSRVLASFLALSEAEEEEAAASHLQSRAQKNSAPLGAPEVNAYEFQSGGVVEMLKKLKDEFRSKLADCQKEEMNSKHAHDMQVQDLTDSVENS